MLLEWFALDWEVMNSQDIDNRYAFLGLSIITSTSETAREDLCAYLAWL